MKYEVDGNSGVNRINPDERTEKARENLPREENGDTWASAVEPVEKIIAGATATGALTDARGAGPRVRECLCGRCVAHGEPKRSSKTRRA